MSFLDTLDPLLKTFWFVAIPASVVFFIQTIMTFIGADAGDGVSADFDGDLTGGDAPLQVFSFRNLINFLLGFSWTGISFHSTISNKTVLVLVALAVGVGFVFLFFSVIKQIQKLAEDNSFKTDNTLHKTAEVYLSIPEKKSGKGKILISVNGSVHELDAMTEQDAISTGSAVKVVKIESNNVIIVEKI